MKVSGSRPQAVAAHLTRVDHECHAQRLRVSRELHDVDSRAVDEDTERVAVEVAWLLAPGPILGTDANGTRIGWQYTF